MARDIPVPPEHLRERVGSTRTTPEDRVRVYLEIGRVCREEILRSLPPTWCWDGRRVLDFGCGAGRTLRQFADEAEVAEFHGCDIDEPSISWLSENAASLFTVARNGPAPPLALPDDHFDLVYALSVFTHLDEHWADWLLELHRVLKPDGLLMATFLGRSMAEPLFEVPWDDGRIGLLVKAAGQPWDHGGPMVMLSPWWIRAHWGRAFDILSLDEEGFAATSGEAHPTQGWVVARPRPERPTRAALVAPESDEPREWVSLAHAFRYALDEQAEVRAALATAATEREALAGTLAAIQAGGWWRLRDRIRPLLRIAAGLRRLAARRAG